MECSNWIRRVLLVLAFYFSNQTEGVLNGKLVEDVNEFKYVVGIQIEFEVGGSLCGGAILDDYHILTAAHCLLNRTNDDFEHPVKVKIRLHTLKNRDSMLQMKRYAQTLYFPTAYFHNNINDGLFENDIAVIKVKKSMNLNGNSRKLQRIELPEQNYLTDGDHGVLAAYGVYDFERGEPIRDGRLRKLDVEVVPNHRCPTIHSIQSKTLMCIKPDPVDRKLPQGNCFGDSGSPIVIKKNGKLVAIGVSSSVENRLEDCNNSNASGFFTKVPKFTNWIRNVMEGTYGASVTTVVDMHYTTSCFW